MWSFFVLFTSVAALFLSTGLGCSLSLSLPACGRKAPASVRRSQVRALRVNMTDRIRIGCSCFFSYTQQSLLDSKDKLDP